MVRIGHAVLGEKGTKICVPIVGTTMKEILDATAVACNTPCHVVELRIDYYERAHSIDAIIELLMLIKPQLKGRALHGARKGKVEKSLFLHKTTSQC